jgi:glycerol-3-phosphate dehydrogenase subunit C
MLRHRARESKQGKKEYVARQLAEMDRNGSVATPLSPLVNWASDRNNRPVRAAMDGALGIDARANLPKFNRRTFVSEARKTSDCPNRDAPAFPAGRKAALFATCFVNYNKASTGHAARQVLNHLGIETRVTYPGCCGMPFLEHAELARVAEQARKISAALAPLVEDGFDIVTPTASCGLMLKFEWPLIVPDDKNVQRVSTATRDIDEYVVAVAKTYGLPAGLKPLPGGVTVHLPCHARAQNMGPKAAEMLRLIPDTKVDVIERCSGHGGTFGVVRPTSEVARKVGKPVFRTVVKQANGHLASDCPLAAAHIAEGARAIAQAEGVAFKPRSARHPIEIFAEAYGLTEQT